MQANKATTRDQADFDRLGEAVDGVRVQARPKPIEDTALAALQLLLRIEKEARDVKDIGELRALIANETRKLTRARQMFVVDLDRRSRPRVVAVSSVGSADRNSPLNQSVETFLARLGATDGLDEVLECAPEQFDDVGVMAAYPLRYLVWVPFVSRGGRVFGGILQAREMAWSERDLVVSRRLAGTFAHSWAAIAGQREPGRRTIFTGKFAAIAAAAIAALMFVPVPMTALGPSEIVAKSPGVVTAPIDG